jgi:CheY-like chemotaxis protein
MRPPANNLDPSSVRWKHQAAVSADSQLSRRLTLIVDDDRDSREALSLILTSVGHAVRLAGDGEEALRLAEQFRPEMVFLDIVLPGMDGYEICHRLRQSPIFEHARIVAISALSGPKHEARCRAAGFTAQLLKPVDPTALIRLG